MPEEEYCITCGSELVRKEGSEELYCLVCLFNKLPVQKAEEVLEQKESIENQ